MYAGRIVERATAEALFRRPRHPYTAGLLAARPRLVPKGGKLPTIAGTVPPPGRRGTGCSFADRCPRVLPRCRSERPELAPRRRGTTGRLLESRAVSPPLLEVTGVAKHFRAKDGKLAEGGGRM